MSKESTLTYQKPEKLCIAPLHDSWGHQRQSLEKPKPQHCAECLKFLGIGLHDRREMGAEVQAGLDWYFQTVESVFREEDVCAPDSSSDGVRMTRRKISHQGMGEGKALGTFKISF